MFVRYLLWLSLDKMDIFWALFFWLEKTFLGGNDFPNIQKINHR